jgi:4-amino-4-deoxy-L-arabinose transferase-like glycosyltransferase
MPVSNLGKFRVSSSIERTHEGLHVANGRTGLSWLDNLWLAASLLFALAVLLRLVDLTSLPRWDEMWTLLSARGWLRDGVPRIGEGAYERAELYTILMAWLLKLFGDSLVVVRLSSILFGSLLVVAVFVWTDAVAGRAAAWVTGLFVALDPLSIEMSVYARFYALQALAFWLGAIGVYALATGQVTGCRRDPRQRLWRSDRLEVSQ